MTTFHDDASGRLSKDKLYKSASDYLDSPAVKLAREYAQSPLHQFASQLGSLGGDAITATKMSAITIGSRGIDPKIVEAIRGVEPLKIDPSLASALHHAQQILEEMRPLGVVAEAFGKYDRQLRESQKAMLASLAGPVGDIARTGQWASILGAVELPSVARLFNDKVGAAIGDIQASLIGSLGQAGLVDQAKMSAMLGLTAKFETDFAATRLKMSALAGIDETFSLQSDLRFDAYQSLFGEWRTRPDLPDNYWRDGRVRRRMYRDAEVDDGLITATPGVALEVMIESGLSAGLRSETNAIAVVTLGEVSMTVRSRGTRKDAYAVLERFEIEMRAYVARKLEERFGVEWFKLRAANLVGKAKNVRKAAMKRGEAFAPLIEFVELGELSSLVLTKQNWAEVFGDVFINRAEFDHDMQKLIAARRPTMHVRTIDSVRLVEMICVVQRLSEQMADDGAWKRQAELDR
jgi:hypothetical protein